MKALGIVGAGGRLGSALERAAVEAGWMVCARATRRGGWVEEAVPEVVVDVSAREAQSAVLEYSLARSLPLVCGVSGLQAADHERLERAAAAIPVLVAPNFSFGHHLQRLALAAILAAAPQARGWRLAVSERHPRGKRDAPSATARVLREDLRAAGAPAGEIEALRGGPPVSDHQVTLSGSGERLMLLHEVGDLAAASSGALHAAEWMRTAPPGRWSMDDVIGAAALEVAG